MRKKRKPLRGLSKKPIFKIPKDKLTETGEYSLKDNEGLIGSPKKDMKPSKTPMTDAEAEAELEKFWNKVKKEIKKGSKN
jgi:hypothetical protein